MIIFPCEKCGKFWENWGYGFLTSEPTVITFQYFLYGFAIVNGVEWGAYVTKNNMAWKKLVIFPCEKWGKFVVLTLTFAPTVRTFPNSIYEYAIINGVERGHMLLKIIWPGKSCGPKHQVPNP